MTTSRCSRPMLRLVFSLLLVSAWARPGLGGAPPKAKVTPIPTPTPTCEADDPWYWPRSAGEIQSELVLVTILDIDRETECRPIGYCKAATLALVRIDRAFEVQGNIPPDGKPGHRWQPGELPRGRAVAMEPMYFGSQVYDPSPCDQLVLALVREPQPSTWVCGRFVACDERPSQEWRVWKAYLSPLPYRTSEN